MGLLDLLPQFSGQNLFGMTANSKAEVPKPVQTEQQRKATEQERQEAERRGFFFTNVAPYELDDNQRKLLTDGANYIPTRVPVNGRTEPFWTIGQGVKLDKDNVNLINKLAGDRIVIDKNFISSESRVPQDIVDKVALQKWDKAVAVADKTLGANNQANYIYASMVYQMGATGAGKFTKTIDLLKMGTAEGYRAAADEIVTSKWNTQTPERVKVVQLMLRDLANSKEQR